MRLGIIADIHGNLPALEAVLVDAQRRGVPKFINLGDILYGPLWPRETYDLLHKVDAVTIQGNQDRDIYEAASRETIDHPTMQFVLDQLGEGEIGWLKSVPNVLEYSSRVYLCHGTPDSDREYLLEDISLGFPVVWPDAVLLGKLGGIGHSLVLCGHTHIPRIVQLSTGAIVLNPGSVGLPAYDDDTPSYHRMENHSPHASYAVVEDAPGGWQLEVIRVAYDYTAAADRARANGRNDWSRWLHTGRAGP